MIIFHTNGKITGYQTFPTTYTGPEAHIVVADGVSLTNKKVHNGALVTMTQEEIDGAAAAAQEAELEAWRNTCEVSRRKALIALYNAGELDEAQAAVDAAGGITKIEWDNALTFKRMNQTVLALGAALEWTAEQIDAIFQAAEMVPD